MKFYGQDFNSAGRNLISHEKKKWLNVHIQGVEEDPCDNVT